MVSTCLGGELSLDYLLSHRCLSADDYSGADQEFPGKNPHRFLCVFEPLFLVRRECYVFYFECVRIREGEESGYETLFTCPGVVDIPGFVNPYEELNRVRTSGRVLATGLDNLHPDGCGPGRRGRNKESKRQYKGNQQVFYYI